MEKDNKITFGSRSGEKIFFGPASTCFGDVSVTITCAESEVKIDVDAVWRDKEPNLEIRMPGYDRVTLDPGVKSATLKKGE